MNASHIPSKVIGGILYDPRSSVIVQVIAQGDKDLYLFRKPSGELFAVEHGERFFFIVGRLLINKYLLLFNADLIPDASLEYHDIEE